MNKEERLWMYVCIWCMVCGAAFGAAAADVWSKTQRPTKSEGHNKIDCRDDLKSKRIQPMARTVLAEYRRTEND